MKMEASSNSQNSGMNSGDKFPSPPPQQLQLQPSGSVPSIFLGPSNISMSTDGNSSSSQTTQTSVWNSGADMQQRVRSPPTSGASSDSYKMKSCASTQCGNNGYEGSSSMAVSTCQPPYQNRAYPPYIQQQQIALPIRSMHQHHHHHHHHHGITSQCHPHHTQQTSMAVAPHIDRMMHGGSSSVAVAAAQQMRSMVMNHYPPNSTGYPHQSTAPTASTFYPQAVTNVNVAGNGPYVEYNHPHNAHHHHHHGHGITAAAAAAVQYAHQQQQHHQRMVSTAAATINQYRHIPVHHQQKVINTSHAAAAYQNAYQHHQYSQYLQHHGVVPSHSHPHAGGASAGVIQQRMLGIPMNNLQQQPQQGYLNRSSQHVHHQQHNNGFPSNCQPPLASNYSGATQQQLMVSSSGTSTSSTNPATGQLLDYNNNCGSSSGSKIMGSSPSEIPGTKPSTTQKTSPENAVVNEKSEHSSMKISSIKLSDCIVNAFPEKSVKLKSTRSVTKLRDRQPRLVVGQKKKSTGNIGGNSSRNSRNLKSLKALSVAVSSGGLILTGGVDNLNSCGKRLTSSLVDSDGNGDAKRSKKVVKTEHALVTTNPNGEEERNREEKGSHQKDNSIEELIRPSPADKYFLEQNGDEYVPTQEEMQKYLERLNICNNLSVPLEFAYTAFRGKLQKNCNKNNIHSSGDGSSITTVTTAEGTYTTTTTTSTSVLYYHHLHNQLEEFNFTTLHNWDSPAISAAELEWNNFQDDMAVLEAFFPVSSTMEQSERAEKLDTIYTYEAQMRLMTSNGQAAATVCTTDGGNQISPPCTCVRDTTPCSCCCNYMTGMMPSPMGSQGGCGTLNEQMVCRNASFDDSAPQLVLGQQGYHPQPHFMSTPLSSRRAYVGGAHFYDEENEYYFKDSGNSAGSRNRIGTRKRSSSYPSRKSGRRTSGSRDHLKSETESFLDELISTAKDEKLSKQKNSGGEVTAPEIQCEVDFPSLASSAAVPYSKRQPKKGNVDELFSARDEYSSSSAGNTEESESNISSACSSSPHSTHNTSSEGDFDAAREVPDLANVGRATGHYISSKASHPVLLPSACAHFEHDTGACCLRPEHLWDDFRGDEVVAMQSESYGPTIGGTSCIPMANLSNLISHCTCRRVDAICPTRPPPGFEHLARPAFPIELYDPSLLGNLIGSQLPREVLSSLDSSSFSRKQFEEMEELLLTLTCCEKHAVDKMLDSRRTPISRSSLEGDEPLEDSDDDWDTLEKAIKNVLNEWTEELGFRKRMQDILFSLNLHDVYGGCCKTVVPLEQGEQETIISSFASSSSKLYTTATDE